MGKVGQRPLSLSPLGRGGLLGPQAFCRSEEGARWPPEPSHTLKVINRGKILLFLDSPLPCKQQGHDCK